MKRMFEFRMLYIIWTKSMLHIWKIHLVKNSEIQVYSCNLYTYTTDWEEASKQILHASRLFLDLWGILSKKTASQIVLTSYDWLTAFVFFLRSCCSTWYTLFILCTHYTERDTAQHSGPKSYHFQLRTHCCWYPSKAASSSVAPQLHSHPTLFRSVQIENFTLLLVNIFLDDAHKEKYYVPLRITFSCSWKMVCRYIMQHFSFRHDSRTK